MINVSTVSRINYLEYKELPSGTPVMNFQVGVRNRKKEDGYTNARVSVFGQQADWLRGHLQNGSVVQLRGSMELISRGDKTYATIYADKVNPFLPEPRVSEPAAKMAAHDDDVPF